MRILNRLIDEARRLREKVEKALEEIRPMLQRDGGDVELVEVTDAGIVKVKLKGACSSCPMAQMTLEMGVKKAIQEKVPEVTEVKAV